MEIDGKQFYLKASAESTSQLGKKLLASLAKEEDYHRLKFEKIYNDVSVKKAWPATSVYTDGGSGLRTVFARALNEPDSPKGMQSEIDAVQTAISMEAKTLDYYRKHGEAAKYDAEIGFYKALAGQEREHQLILLDYYEYLKNPAEWYTHKERLSLDGG
jgi:rubrerythrin